MKNTQKKELGLVLLLALALSCQDKQAPAPVNVSWIQGSWPCQYYGSACYANFYGQQVQPLDLYIELLSDNKLSISFDKMIPDLVCTITAATYNDRHCGVPGTCTIGDIAFAVDKSDTLSTLTDGGITRSLRVHAPYMETLTLTLMAPKGTISIKAFRLN